MKYSEICESSVLTERPFGIFRQMKSKMASHVPGTVGDRAAGEFEAGENANDLYREYFRDIGRTGQQIDAQSLSAFFNFHRVLTPGVQQMIASVNPLTKRSIQPIFIRAIEEKNLQQQQTPIQPQEINFVAGAILQLPLAAKRQMIRDIITQLPPTNQTALLNTLRNQGTNQGNTP